MRQCLSGGATQVGARRVTTFAKYRLGEYLWDKWEGVKAKGAEGEGPRVVDQDVQAAEALHHEGHDPLRLAALAHVGAEVGRPLGVRLGEGLQGLLSPAGDDDPRAERDEALRRREADPGAAAGDQDYAVFKAVSKAIVR